MGKSSQRVTRAKEPCLSCGTKFVPTRRDNHYCSGACRQRAHRARKNVSDIDRRIDEARATGATESQVLTDEAQTVDEDGNVFVRGKLVGKTKPFRPGWSSWGLEAAPPPFAPPTSYWDQAAREERA